MLQINIFLHLKQLEVSVRGWLGLCTQKKALMLLSTSEKARFKQRFLHVFYATARQLLHNVGSFLFITDYNG